MNDSQPDSPEEVLPEMESAVLFFSILNSVKFFNDQELKGILSNQLKPTELENSFLTFYWRAVHNVDSMLELKHVLHFQALAMLSRTMLELACDVHLLESIPHAVLEIVTFNSLERLKAARGVLKYTAGHPMSIPLNTSTQQAFVDSEATKIEHSVSILWPGLKPKSLSHWSALNLRERAQKVGAPVEEIYELYHRILSWQVHSGGAGVMGLPPDAFPRICSLSYRVAALTFEEVIKQVAKEFHLHTAIESLDAKLAYAKALPVTSGPEEELRLAKELGLM